MVKDNIKKANDKKSNIDNRAKRKKNIKFASVIVILSIIAIIIIYNLTVYIINQKYIKYEKQMNSYGLNELYNNKSAKTTEKVSKTEVLKLVLAVTLNTNSLAYETGYSKYPDQNWVEYSKENNIIDTQDINENNYNSREIYINAIKEIANSLQNILNIYISNENLDIKIKNYNKLSDEEKNYVKMLVSANIIENSDYTIDLNKKMNKGMLNELIIKYFEKYGAISNKSSDIVSNGENMPSNSDQYPYILKSVDKNIYEITNFIYDQDMYKNPKETYKIQKENYDVIIGKVEKYLNTIFNIDYNTINKDKFITALYDNLLYMPSEETVNEYVNYVKENKISIESTVKVQDPAIYYDGMRYRVRTKINYNIKSADKLTNVIYLDNKYKNETTYNLGKKTIILDVPVQIATGQVYVSEFSIQDSISGNVVDTYTFYENTNNE